ncbi:MAG TPA: sodium:solute symporter family protein, partial [Verrucomicrobiae bacterium]|nr:sodium:solute symporter family protein [Verrucomicrobiae bacterium]
GGILIGTMIVSLIITGAGLTLGAVTILIQDLAPRFRIKPSLKSMRAAVVAVMGVALGLVLVDTQSLILKYAFLSMALRGVTVFIPLVGAIFWQSKLNPAAGVRAVAIAPLAAVGWYVFGIKEIDPLYIGLAVSLCVMFFGLSFHSSRNYRNLQDS